MSRAGFRGRGRSKLMRTVVRAAAPSGADLRPFVKHVETFDDDRELKRRFRSLRVSIRLSSRSGSGTVSDVKVRAAVPDVLACGPQVTLGSRKGHRTDSKVSV